MILFYLTPHLPSFLVSSPFSLPSPSPLPPLSLPSSSVVFPSFPPLPPPSPLLSSPIHPLLPSLPSYPLHFNRYYTTVSFLNSSFHHCFVITTMPLSFRPVVCLSATSQGWCSTISTLQWAVTLLGLVYTRSLLDQVLPAT